MISVSSFSSFFSSGLTLKYFAFVAIQMIIKFNNSKLKKYSIFIIFF